MCGQGQLLLHKTWSSIRDDRFESTVRGSLEMAQKIDASAWARFAMDHTCKTDLVVNNLSEVFNKMILDVRAKPIRQCLKGLGPSR